MASSQVVKGLVLRSSLNLKAISNSSKAFSSGMQKASKLTRKISEDLQSSVISKRKLIANDASFFRKRRDAVKRKENESIIEAAGISGAVKRTGKVISDSTKGFFGRVLDFVGYTMVGWLVTQLPGIIKGATALMKRIQGVIDTLTRWTNFVVGIFTGVDYGLQTEKQKLESIRLQENVNELNKQLDRTTSAFGEMESQLWEGEGELNSAIDEENKKSEGTTEDGSQNQAEGKNQWWDFLDLFPNKQKEKDNEQKEEVQPQEELIPNNKKEDNKK